MRPSHASTRNRVIVPAAAGAVLVVLLGPTEANASVAAPPPASSVDYSCTFAFGDLLFGPEPVPVTFHYGSPALAVAGRPVASQSLLVRLPMPPALHEASVDGLGARTFTARSPDMSITVNGRQASRSLPAPLVIPRSPVPASSQPWVIDVTTRAPSFQVPRKTAGHTLQVDAPAYFSISGIYHLFDSTSRAIGLRCVAAQGPRPISSIRVMTRPRLTLPTGRRIGSTAGQSTRVKVRVQAPVTARGRVIAKVGKRTVGSARVRSGRAVLRLRPLRTLGTRRLTIRYLGDNRLLPAKKSIRWTVRRS